jgi:signal transduction histidine kinase
MSDEQCAEPSQDAGAAAEQPWAEGYDMSPMRRDEALTYCVFADPHCGIASAPLPSTERGQHLATLAVWAPRITPTSQAVFTRYPAPFCPQADSAGSPHLKIMGELTVSIAHEICQPLLSIASNAAACMRWLQRETPDLEEAISGLQDIRAECERAADIVSALRALAKQTPCKPQPVNINDVIGEVIRLTQASLSKHAVTLETHLDADQTVIADPVQIQQLVFNLFTNAIEAMSGSGSSECVLRVSTRSLSDGVQVSVEDNGPGIPIEQRKQIFGAFYTTKSSGLGMGLTICRSVIEAHQGNLYAETSEMGGTMIRFQLPAGCKNH